MSAFETYLTDEKGRSGNTARAYGLVVAAFHRWNEQTNGVTCNPAALTRADVRDYRDHLQAVQRLKPATINYRLAALHAWAEWLVETEQIADNPVAGVKRIGEVALAPKWPERKSVAALERELERAVNNARTETARFLAVRDRAMIQLLMHTGLRVGELCALELSDLELSDRKGRLTVRHGKGNKLRHVPLNLDARRAVEPWLELRPPAESLFTAKDGGGLVPRLVQHALKTYTRRAGVTITPHGLRHYYGKRLADAGVEAVQIAALLGHSKLDTTRRYTLPSERDLERAVEKLEG